MTIKITMLMQMTSAISNINFPLHRVGGWSESWYYPGTNLQAAFAALFNPIPIGGLAVPFGLCGARAALLPTGAAIVGQRLQVVDPAGLSQSLSNTFPGSSGQLADTPQTALLLRVPGIGVRNIRRVAIRGIPDVDVVEGEYQSQGGFDSSLKAFWSVLGAGGFLFRGRDLTQTVYNIITVTTTGLVTCVQNVTPVVGQMWRVLKTRDASGNLRGGVFQVATVGPNSNQFTLTGWPFAGTTGGSTRNNAAFVYPAVDAANITTGRIVIKKVGRPFAGYRGRRSRRR